MSTRKVKAGENWKPPSASDQNAWGRAADYYTSEVELSKPAPADRNPIPTDVIKVKNISGSDVARGGVLSLNGEFRLDEVTREYIWMHGTVDPYAKRLFAICIDPIPDGDIYRAQVSGVCPAKVTITNDAHRRAKLVGGADKLESNFSGPVQILYKPDGTGELICVVNLSNRAAVKLLAIAPDSGIDAGVKTDDVIVPGSAVCDLWFYDTSQSKYVPLLDSGSAQVTDTVYNPWETAVAASSRISISEDDDGLLTVADKPVSLVAFRLDERVETVDDFPKDAYLIDSSGTAYGDKIHVTTPPVMTGNYGPADVGFEGWCVFQSAGSSGLPDTYVIVHMQRFAEYIHFTNATFTPGTCIAEGVGASDYWHGEQPTSLWNVNVDASHLPHCECLGPAAEGIAALDEIQSAFPDLVYRLVDADQMLQIVGLDECATDACQPGGTIRTLIVGDGMSLVTPGCYADDPPCPALISADGLTVDSISCDSTPEEPGTDDTSDGNIRTLSFREPFSVSVSGDCPASAIIGLPSDLITGGTCITVSQSDCSYTINNETDVIAGDGIAVQKSGCAYSISLSGGNTSNTTAIQFVCDITCEEQSDGSWLQVVKYGTLTIPTAIITSLESECEDPLFTCDDCANCEANETKIIKDDGSECNCIADTATIPSGWSECAPGTGIPGSVTVDAIDCDAVQPFVAVTVHWIPAGATWFIVTSAGQQGTAVGTVLDPAAGQTYFIALVDGWGDTLPGECFDFVIRWKDDAGNDVGTSMISNNWCC